MCVGVARGNQTVMTVARWTTGCAAAASATLFVMGILPETTTAAAVAQSFCFAVLVFVRPEGPGKPHMEKYSARALIPARPSQSQLSA